MIREIVKDEEKLKIPCIPVTKFELTYKNIGEFSSPVNTIVDDLIDTAKHYESEANCVGLASNQIGYDKCIIVAKIHNKWVVMINPRFIPRKISNKIIQEVSEEGCLSLDGVRNVVRFKHVTVLYTDINRKSKKLNLSGFPAFIIQHECDHLKGKLI